MKYCTLHSCNTMLANACEDLARTYGYWKHVIYFSSFLTLLHLFPFAWTLQPATLDSFIFSKHTLKSISSMSVTSIFSAYNVPPLCVNVYDLQISHTPDIFLFQKILPIHGQTRSISDFPLFFCCYETVHLLLLKKSCAPY